MGAEPIHIGKKMESESESESEQCVTFFYVVYNPMNRKENRNRKQKHRTGSVNRP